MSFVLCSEEDVTDFICENKNKNTQTKTKGDVALFTRFLLGVGEELPPEQLRPELLDKWISRFFLSVTGRMSHLQADKFFNK